MLSEKSHSWILCYFVEPYTTSYRHLVELNPAVPCGVNVTGHVETEWPIDYLLCHLLCFAVQYMLTRREVLVVFVIVVPNLNLFI